MQLGIGGTCGDFFDAYKVDGGHDGVLDPRDPWDSVFTSANGLRRAKGLPPVGRAGPEDYYRAACAYYGICDDYAPAIIATARRYGGPAWWQGGGFDGSAGPGCASVGTGEVVIAPGANLPGKPLQPVLLGYLARMAAITGHRIIVTTGTSHSEYTIDGNVSDHFAGNAADLGNSANGGVAGNDANFQACLILSGVPPARVDRMVRTGGLFTLYYAGLRIQCIWKTFDGGNHYTHLHVGVRPA
jgi:hypothetical protein